LIALPVLMTIIVCPVRVITQHAWHNMFAKNMFIEATAEQLADFEPVSLCFMRLISKRIPTLTALAPMHSLSLISRKNW
jgi:hypothetical protein